MALRASIPPSRATREQCAGPRHADAIPVNVAGTISTAIFAAALPSRPASTPPSGRATATSPVISKGRWRHEPTSRNLPAASSHTCSRLYRGSFGRAAAHAASAWTTHSTGTPCHHGTGRLAERTALASAPRCVAATPKRWPRRAAAPRDTHANPAATANLAYSAHGTSDAMVTAWQCE